ncbi:alpha-L-fucosidase [Flammeovirga yaeyamensis]|nr:alpha-L-fucosidase [Flammeovirga yaeyamensis]MBB3696871.1 alpha-L-fucosidase [Flammeovirga yaeyamensis]NMF33536.1 alpha-L-fucosidase precursor [Flammeovirga yaeyamensis]
MKRRQFLELASMAGAATFLMPSCMSNNGDKQQSQMPDFMKGYEELYQKDPRQAAIKCFEESKYGMFIHYGLYSLLGRHEWVQIKEKIHVAEYAKLMDRFTADKFDADFITDLALEAEMKYINLTTRHHDSFCLWDTKYTDFKSTNSPAKRDLVAELYEQCNQKGLALHLYYSHGRDWRHPHAPNNDKWGGHARPEFDVQEPFYKYGEEHDLNLYVEFLYNQVAELIDMFPNIASIWLDGHGVPKSGDHTQFKCQELYDMIHQKQPHMLVSYKQGLLGTEDFLAPERKYKKNGKPEKPLEICDHLQRKGWGYLASEDGNHKSKKEVIKMLKKANSYPANLLLNTGPYGSGEMHPEDVKVLREVGEEIRSKGWNGVLG